MKRLPSNNYRLSSRSWRAVLALIAAVGIFAGALGVSGASAPLASAAGSLPCDIYASGGTPCVAAHSTVRALFSAYNGNLYQVRRASDNATLDIGVLSAGGYANAAAQDSFCAGTSCVITIIYDQSGRGNNLTQAPGGGAAGGPDNLANASALPVTVGGHHVYGVYIAAGMGYRDDNTNGIATGDNPEGEYAVFDGTHYNGGCCFDYGNAETSNNDTGAGHMEAIYFGNCNFWGTGSGSGPWVMADLENGLFSGQNAGFNGGDQSINANYVTAMVKGGANLWAIKGGNAQSGGLTTMYNGVRPNGYNPMHKEGAIILGIGGDNSNGSAGSFFEGAMTSGYPSDATENAVQTAIVSANYSSPSYYHLVNRNSGLVADVSGASTSQGANVIQWPNNGGSNQDWSLVPTGDGYDYLVNRNSGQVLDVNGASTSNGASVIQWPNHSGTNQQWSLQSTGDGYDYLVNRNSGLVLDVNGASTSQGAQIIQWSNHGGSNQQWSLVQV